MNLFHRLSKKIIAILICFTGSLLFIAPSNAEPAPGILATTLTFYKNGALIRQGQLLPLSIGKHLMHITGIANSIIKDSLMASLSALPTEATITESTFSKTDGETTLVLDLIVNSTVHEPKSYANLIYLLQNMGWKPLYAIQFTSGYQQLMFNGWIEITNTAGISFKNAQIQFVEGNIPVINGENIEKSNTKAKGYSYKGILDMEGNETKRLNWVSSSSLKSKQDHRIFVGGKYLNDMDGKPESPIAETWVSFHNTTDNTLGQDLPQGPVVLYYQDEHGQLEVLGSTTLSHIATGQEISVRIPSTQIDKFEKNSKKEAKRIETKLVQNQFRASNETQMTEAHYCLDLKNTGSEAQIIRVVLDLPDDVTNWEIIRETQPREKNVENNIHWNVPVPANGHAELKYHIRFIKETP